MGVSLRVRFLVTPVGLMMGNIESARRLARALTDRRVEVDVQENAKNAGGQYDILHVHTPVPPRNLRMVNRARGEGIPVVMHAHTTVEDSIGTWSGSKALSGLTSLYLTRFYNHADLVLAPSAWTAERLRVHGIRVPIQVLSNGVDLSRFRDDDSRRLSFRRRYGIPGDAMTAYSVGVMCLKKGIETFPEVTSQMPDIQFAWVGRRSRLYHPLRVRRAVDGCGRNVRFLQDVQDIVDAHCGGDVLFMPSFAENQGMAVLEAMAVGRPVVARDLPSYAGLLEDGRTALLGRSPKDFASALQRLRDDQGLARSLVANARDRVKSHSISLVAEKLESIYQTLIQSREAEGVVTG